MKSKSCSKCKNLLPLDLFGPSKRGLMGRKSICRKCLATQFNDWYSEKSKSDPDWNKKRIQNSVEWSKNNPEARSRIAIKRNQREKMISPEKVKARALVNQRVRFGRIPKASSLNCFRCGSPAKHYHHHNGYNFEHRYDVVPVCAPCHKLID